MKRKSQKQPIATHKLNTQFSIDSFLSKQPTNPSNIIMKENTIIISNTTTIDNEVRKDRTKRELMLINQGCSSVIENIDLKTATISNNKEKAFESIVFPILIRTSLGIDKNFTMQKLINFVDERQKDKDISLIALTPSYLKDTVNLNYQSETIGYITKTVSYNLCRIAVNQIVQINYYLKPDDLEVIIQIDLKSIDLKIKDISMEEIDWKLYNITYGKNCLGMTIIKNLIEVIKYSLNSQLEFINDKLINNNRQFQEIITIFKEYHNSITKKTESARPSASGIIDTSMISEDNDDSQSQSKDLYMAFLLSNYENILSMITSYSFLFSQNDIEMATKAQSLSSSQKKLLLKFITRSSKWISPIKLEVNSPDDLNSLLTNNLIESNEKAISFHDKSPLFEFLSYLQINQLKEIQSKLSQMTKLKPTHITINSIPDLFINNSFYSLDSFMDISELSESARQISQMITQFNFDINEQKKRTLKDTTMDIFSNHYRIEITNKNYNNSYIAKNLNYSNYKKVHLTAQNYSPKNLLILSIIHDVGIFMKDKSSLFIEMFINSGSNTQLSQNTKTKSKDEQVKSIIIDKYPMYQLNAVFAKVFDCASRLFFFYSDYKDINSMSKEFYGMESFESYHNYISHMISLQQSTIEKNTSVSEFYMSILKPIFITSQVFRLYDNLFQIKNAYLISSMALNNPQLNYKILSSLYMILLEYLDIELYRELCPQKVFPSTNENKEKKIDSLISKLKNKSVIDLKDDFLSKYSHCHIIAELLTYYGECCEKEKEFHKANIIYLFLLLSSHLIKKRGHWWHRAILNFAHHMKNKANAIQLLNLTKYDHTIKSGYLVKIKEYYQRILKEKTKGKKTNKILNTLEDNLFDSVKHENDDIIDYSSYVKTIKSDSVMSELSGRRLYGIGNAIVNVEEYALKYYKINGNFEGIHGENEVIPTLYNIFFWNEIYYDKIPYVFQSPYQTFPLDFFYSNFYASRKDIIDARLKTIESFSDKKLIETINSIYINKKNVKSVFINWNSLQCKKETLIKIAVSLTAKKLTAIFTHLTKNMKFLLKGMPDLFLWKEIDHSHAISDSALVVEVKSLNDKLSDHQKFWLSLLSKADIKVQILHIK